MLQMLNHPDAIDPVKRVGLSLGAVIRSVNSVVDCGFALALRPSPYKIPLCFFGYHNWCISPTPTVIEMARIQSKTVEVRVAGSRV